MRAISLSLLSFFITLHALSAYAATEGAPPVSGRTIREDCSANSQAGMRDCLANRAKDSEQSLKTAEDAVAAALAKWNEDAKYAAAARNRLQAAGKAFVSYRDAQCTFDAALGGGAIGNALEMRRLACVAEMNDRRAQQLRDAAADLPAK